MTESDQTAFIENSPDKSERPLPGFWSGAWWKTTSVVLLASPLLGFIISGIAIVLITAITPSGRREWFGKLVLALVLLVPARIAGFYLAYEWAYDRGYQEAVLATEHGEEFLIAGGNWLSMMCVINDDLDIGYALYSGRKAGNKAALPEYAHDPYRAIDMLIEKGCLVSFNLYHKVNPMKFRNEQQLRDRCRQLLNQGSLFHSDKDAVVIEGDEITDADMKFVNAFAWFRGLDYLEINAPQVSADALKALSTRSHTPGRRLWLRMGVLRISRSRLSEEDLRHFSAERDDVMIATDTVSDDVSNELRFDLRDARKRRAEWKSRQAKVSQ